MWLLSPKTPHQLLCGVLRHMSSRVVNPECLNFIEKKDSQFKSLHGTMDSHFHHLHATEVGWQTKHARVLTKDDEDKLWNSGVMGTRTPRAVQNAVFYVVGKMFSLRGGVEMRQVKISKKRRHVRQICVHGACFKAQQWNVKKAAHCKQSCSSDHMSSSWWMLPCACFGLLCALASCHKKPSSKIFFLIDHLNDPTKPWYSSVPVGKDIQLYLTPNWVKCVHL